MSINLNNVTLSRVAGTSEQHIKKGYPQIAFSGRSNVGKSSLINSLLMRKSLARVSSTPGKTITVNYYLIAGKAFFVDLPGYGFAKRSKEEKVKWSEVTNAYFDSNEAIKLIVQLVDSKVGITPDDATMFEYMNYYNLPYAVVFTKCDKLNKTQLNECREKIKSSPFIKEGTEFIMYSSLKNTGREELMRIILKLID